jgi:hypothetical protein
VCLIITKKTVLHTIFLDVMPYVCYKFTNISENLLLPCGVQRRILNGTKSKKTVIFIVTTVRTSDCKLFLELFVIWSSYCLPSDLSY